VDRRKRRWTGTRRGDNGRNGSFYPALLPKPIILFRERDDGDGLVMMDDDDGNRVGVKDAPKDKNASLLPLT
jgi:hypothetical protein